MTKTSKSDEKPPSLIPTHERLVLCEGPADVAFYSRVAGRAGIVNLQFHAVNGDTNFGIALTALQPIWSLEGKPKAILIIADNDDTPGTSFSDVRKQIRDANYPVPDQAEVRAATPEAQPTPPSVTVLMVPTSTEEGCLETLCWRGLTEVTKAEVIKCVESFEKCALQGHGASKAHEAKVQALIAALNPKQPNRALRIVIEKGECNFPLDCKCYSHVIDVMRAFSEDR